MQLGGELEEASRIAGRLVVDAPIGGSCSA